ncbi:ThuA domain-containing protein [Luteolibacter marinus]|uniref:ThuA domain-containing protein n=1 Tax=Luteolibacter marinus TaxID=2776705 RepID=UPI001865E11A|nr:ThuA domain-containing protein [Luteolibacter marinus]
MKNLLLVSATTALFGLVPTVHGQDAAKPLKVMLITGGCCHDYKAQTEILKKGLEERINVTVDQVHVDDGSTKPALPIYGNPDYAAGYDLVIHDECAADIKDPEVVKGVLKPHRDGMPAVNLHCAMHSYRTGDFRKKVTKLGGDGSLWFEFLGLQSSGHGRQQPIDISFVDTSHPVTKGAADWTTINEELYNNVRLFDDAHPLAKGKQGKDETVVVWTNTYGDKHTRVFSTTIGHNNATVEDARYLDMVAKGLLWAADKLDANGRPKAGYGRPKK